MILSGSRIGAGVQKFYFFSPFKCMTAMNIEDERFWLSSKTTTTTFKKKKNTDQKNDIIIKMKRNVPGYMGIGGYVTETHSI